MVQFADEEVRVCVCCATTMPDLGAVTGMTCRIDNSQKQIPPHDRDTVQDGPADDTDAVRFDFEQLPDTAAAIIKSSQPHDEDEGAHSVNNVEYLPGLPPKKMEASQQTPTQVNDGRDYNEFCDHIPPSPVDNTNNVHSIDDTTQMTNNEPRTLQEDDTGAVNFGNLSQLARPSSQISEDGGFENTKSEWRIPEQTPRQHSASGYTPFKPQSAAPETPALPKNPFGARPNIGGAPFAGTQLFGQTQFSSAVKVSPTSSRPSPNLFLNSISPNLMETSPLKNRANVSSPTDIRTSALRGYMKSRQLWSRAGTSPRYKKTPRRTPLPGTT